jgi:hypothetical protein
MIAYSLGSHDEWDIVLAINEKGPFRIPWPGWGVFLWQAGRAGHSSDARCHGRRGGMEEPKRIEPSKRSSLT